MVERPSSFLVEVGSQPISANLGSQISMSANAPVRQEWADDIPDAGASSPVVTNWDQRPCRNCRQCRHCESRSLAAKALDAGRTLAQRHHSVSPGWVNLERAIRARGRKLAAERTSHRSDDHGNVPGRTAGLVASDMPVSGVNIPFTCLDHCR